MKTEELIDTLTADLKPIPRAAVAKRLALAAGIGSAIALAAVGVAYGLREDFMNALLTRAFWMKASFTGAMAVLAFIATERAGRPGSLLRRHLGLLALPFAAILLASGMELAPLTADVRLSVWFGETWRSCPWSIIALSLPSLVLLLRATRHFAPTRPAAAGFAVGMLSSALAATAYGLHCPETAASFVATWYGLGMLGTGCLGAILGTRALRW